MPLTLLRHWKIAARSSPIQTGGMSVPAPETVELDGVLLGALVSHRLGVQFIASNDRLTDMDQSVWPNPEYARRAARQMFGSNDSTSSL